MLSRTNPKIIERCMLMTTDPGDLVLTRRVVPARQGYVAEQWGRRWITTDTSRVAVAIARQRLLTAKYEFFKLKDESAGVQVVFGTNGPAHHPQSIAQNANLDPIFSKHEPILDARSEANAELETVPDKLRQDSRVKLALKQKHEGKKAITEADCRRWERRRREGLASTGTSRLIRTRIFRPAQAGCGGLSRRLASKMTRLTPALSPMPNRGPCRSTAIDRKVTRVSGPFTVEAVSTSRNVFG